MRSRQPLRSKPFERYPSYMDDEKAAPGSPANPAPLTDPGMMRALAHPARFAILSHLALGGPATATECAQVAGLSPSACSYHLRQLARYGIIEEAPDTVADGRQRPWRARMVAFHVPEHDPDPAAQLAGAMLRDALHEDAEQTRARYLNRKSEYPAAWREAAGDVHDVAFVTPEELMRIRQRISDVFDEFRRLDPAERPEGTLPVRAWLNLYPFFGPQDAR